MATYGFRPYKKDDKDEDENVKGPMEYVSETGECICGWCGQLLIPNHTKETPEAHFKSCKNSKDNGLLRVFKELRNVQHSLKVLNDKMETMKAEVMEEVKANHVNMKTELNNEILTLKTEIKVELETLKKVVGESKDGAFVAFNNKVKVLEDGMKEKMREMGVAQDMKMAEVSGRFTGVTETIMTVVHFMLEGVRGKSSADTNELAPLKRDMEALSEQGKSNDRDFRVLKIQLENEGVTDEATKKSKGFHVAPSEQLTIPMNCFNLVTHNHLFQPSFRWIIDGMDAKLSQTIYEESSELFQWNGYPVQARAKLQLKEDDYVHISMDLKDSLKGKSRLIDIAPIPRVYYLFKHNSLTHATHKCSSTYYFFGSRFSSFLAFRYYFKLKTWRNLLTYKVNDAVEIEVYVEPPRMTQHVYSYDGTLEWNMENYASRLRLEKDGLVPYQESPYLYTSQHGYRVQVDVFLNGKEGKGLTARILFVKGKFDADLPKSFLHSTTVALINGKDSQRSISKTIAKKIFKLCDDVEMCKLEEVEKFVENDALFFKVRIQSQ